MSEPPKSAETAPKETVDFVTKYKVRLTFDGCKSAPHPRGGKIIDFIVNPFWMCHTIAARLSPSPPHGV